MPTTTTELPSGGKHNLPTHLYKYPLLPTRTLVSDAKALANRDAMLELVKELEENLTWATGQGQGKYQKQHLSRGMMLGASESRRTATGPR